MGFKRFSVLLTVRVCLILGSVLLVGWLFSQPGYQASVLLSVLVLIGLVYEALRFVNLTNAELARFLETVRHGELNQRFDYQGYGAGFEQLGEAFTDIANRFQSDRESQEQTLRHLKALIEQVPVPLLSLHGDGRITLWNHSARRLFGSQLAQKLDELSEFDAALPEALMHLVPGERKLLSIESEGMTHQLSLSATHVITAGVQDKLVSLQDIRSELGAAQLQAWQDLVRVLTHEIMNSITPVASLAETASDLVNDIMREDDLSENVRTQLQDVQDATLRLSKRSNSLMHFVSSYRRLTRLPPPNKQAVSVAELLDNVTQLAAQDWPESGISLRIHIEPKSLSFNVDIGMIEQVLINLLKNAQQALTGSGQPQVDIHAYINRRNHCVITVSDNGPGIAPDIVDRIFVPFFTTKRDGSGVGLALTRQVMIAHGGDVKVTNQAQGGACFTLTF
ncbi:PAS domain-containing protein [Alteromonas sediminis]|uniref:histidine kinase n=1 Tax=Alteromonas sediminis TaxID=2259342 RepID=A0A3N5XZ02_9ALTE|nr:ATP-binding protein [Alteromonas sediminis]RPJ65920.1 PAS domain-containing protein [Alteromonas sediminis]